MCNLLGKDFSLEHLRIFKHRRETGSCNPTSSDKDTRLWKPPILRVWSAVSGCNIAWGRDVASLNLEILNDWMDVHWCTQFNMHLSQFSKCSLDIDGSLVRMVKTAQEFIPNSLTFGRSGGSVFNLGQSTIIRFWRHNSSALDKYNTPHYSFSGFLVLWGSTADQEVGGSCNYHKSRVSLRLA